MNFKYIFYLLFITSINAFAQKTQVQLAQNSLGKLQVSISKKEDIKQQLSIIGEGIKAIELAENDKKTKNWPETWAVKAYLSSYIALVDGDNNADKHFILATDALEKATTLDKFQANSSLIKAATYNINIKKQNEGNKMFMQNDFTNAFNYLKQVSDYLPKDTTLAVNVGICAQNIQLYNDALLYFKRAKDNGVRNPIVYQNMANIYASKFDSEAAIKTLEDGLAVNPYHPFLTNDYINLLLDNERYDKATKIIEGSIITDKRNKLLLFLYGYLQQSQLNNKSAAELAYQKALDIDRNYFNALYQLGLIYINNANEALKSKETKQFISHINRAEFILQRAHEINLNDKNTLQLLIEIYTRKNRLDRVQEFKRKLNEF
ncbi:tetratricopeptide repeat protein [Pedobacter cryotolerans]|uniref:Uncharacterized protein n=1 Tax=Pedobacter cryotolerans TaxID=2571270 RepID=A0A4U1BZV9_9SPHI|nr:hypothetical protein [Pedobacter cryotolerans]TKB98411.1 hypothetical protein FA045_13915 [Pedobacter cryotolerans]